MRAVWMKELEIEQNLDLFYLLQVRLWAAEAFELTVYSILREFSVDVRSARFQLAVDGRTNHTVFFEVRE